MEKQLFCQICTETLIKTTRNGIVVYECPICGQLHDNSGKMIEYKDLCSDNDNENN